MYCRTSHPFRFCCLFLFNGSSRTTEGAFTTPLMHIVHEKGKMEALIYIVQANELSFLSETMSA